MEFLGTYALALTASASGDAAAIGFVLVALVYAFSDISRGHFNPAVTMAVFVNDIVNDIVNKKNYTNWLTPFKYVLAQFLGALLGGLQHMFVLKDKDMTFGEENIPTVQAGVSKTSALISELTATMIFTVVILNVTTGKARAPITTVKARAPNPFFGIAIGFALTAAIAAVGDISGGCLNPALGTVLPALAGKTDDIWIYVVGPLLGGVLGALFFRCTTDPKELLEITTED